MKRPNFEPIFESENDFCEQSSENPHSSFVPNQALNLSELISRFERGQRLNVHNNFAPGENFTRDVVYEESFEDAPPDDVHDVVDVHNYYNEHEVHKRDFKSRMEKKKTKEKEVTKEAPTKEEAPEEPSK